MNEELIQVLDKILPVVERVHGEHHPELHQVAALYKELKADPSADIFRRISEVTSGYAVPSDACPTYRKAYECLSELAKDFA